MAFLSNLLKKKSKKNAVSNSTPTPSPVSVNTPSPPLAAPVAVAVSHVYSTPFPIDTDASNAQVFTKDATPTSAPESSSTSPTSQSTSAISDSPIQKIQGRQIFRAEVVNTNEAGNGTAQIIEGHQQFFEAVENNNVVTTNSNNVGSGNINSTITGDTVTYMDLDGTELQISQRTTSNTLSPAAPVGTTALQPPASTAGPSPGSTQIIAGGQVFHSAMTNNNISGSGTAQVIDGEQEFWGPVVNNNTRTTNTNNANCNNLNSTITGNTIRYTRRTPQASAPAIYAPDVANAIAHLMANQYSRPNNQTHYLTDSSEQDAMPLPVNGNLANVLNALMSAAAPEEQIKHLAQLQMAQLVQATTAQYSR